MRLAPTETTIQTYTLEVLARSNENGSPRIRLSHLFLHQLEQHVADVLPTGFTVRIKEWDE